MKWARFIKIAYITTALSGAILLHEFPNVNRVYAQSIQDQYQNYSLQTSIQVNSKLIDQLYSKETQIDKHLESTDSKLNDLSDKISNIQGIGSGILGALGLLQILGLIKDLKTHR